MAKFKKGDKVRVTYVDRNDTEYGIYVGCRGVVDEDDTTPYVLFPNARRAMMESQLELVENSADKEESGWIEWSGGECPVAAVTEVEIKFMDGDVWRNMGDPESLRWSHDGFSSDIIAYRVVEEAKEEFAPGTTTVDVGSPVQEDSGSAATSKHYNAQAIQPIELMQLSLSPEEFKGFLKGNIMKYSMRAGSKAGESVFKDTVKAKQYKMWLDLVEQGVKIDPRTHVVIKGR